MMFPHHAQGPLPCKVCGEIEEDPRNRQECFDCGGVFHLNPRNDLPGKDCGDAWIGESLGLEYFCQDCIDLQQAEAMQAQGGDAAAARIGAMMQALEPGGALRAPQPPTPSGAPRSPRPPRPQRPKSPRRYRRVG